jgi:hypothetical protein
VYLWHDPEGGAPRWAVVDVFEDLVGSQQESPADYYPVYPQGAVRHSAVTTHPQITADNIVDFRHFATVHGTGLRELREWKAEDATFRSTMDFRAGSTSKIVASLELVLSGVGIVFTLQEGRMPQRVSLATTPTRPGNADPRLMTWLQREDGDSTGTSKQVSKRYATAAALPQEIEIWQHHAMPNGRSSRPTSREWRSFADGQHHSTHDTTTHEITNTMRASKGATHE